MKRTYLLALIPFTALSFCVVGCDEAYSEALRYGVRTDPVPLTKLGDEYPFPDQPGQMPILSIDNFQDERNPYFAAHQKNDLIKGKVFLDPTKLADAGRQQIRQVLDKFFGTPAKPTVGGIDDDDLKKQALEVLKLDDKILALGSQEYRKHCLHCHGVTGDGRGPTARWVNPHPRDYRQGRFKFESVDQTQTGQMPPHRDDLMRTLEVGVEGTAMPSFVVLPSDVREALVSYVIHLSLRGMAEFNVFKNKIDENTLKLDSGETLEQVVKDYQFNNVSAWVKSQDPANRIKVAPYPYDDNEPDLKQLKASVARGKELFSSPRPEWAAKIGKDVCITCHKDYGRQSYFRYDEWGTFAKPNNLLMGVYRGGRRPVDIYYRVHSGIPPSTMNAFANLVPTDPGGKNTNALWDIVNFVRVLGNPNMRQKMGIYVD